MLHTCHIIYAEIASPAWRRSSAYTSSGLQSTETLADEDELSHLGFGLLTLASHKFPPRCAR